MTGPSSSPNSLAATAGIDYLVDEEMARQPEEVQTFLLRTSILERFCAPLCEYVAGGNKDMDIIDYLDHSNLFLIPLDDHKEWYRYHHLFADFLGQRLRESERDRIPELHRRASQWYKNEGLVDEAIEHALAAGDLENAIRLIDHVAMDLVVRRESNKLLKLIDKLPPDRCQDYPVLCILHAWGLLFLGQLEAVEPILQNAETNQSKAPGVPIPGYVTTVRSYLANLEGDLLKSIDLSEQALEEMSVAAPDRITQIFQGAAVIWLGLNHRLLGHLDKARLLFIEAAKLNQKAGNFYAALASFEQLAKLAVIRGQLHQALDLYRSGLKVAQNWMDTEGKPQGALTAAVVGPQLSLGAVLYQLNDLAGATIHIQRSASLLELGEHWGRMNAYTLLAYLKQAQGEFGASAELFRKACAIEDTILVRRSNTSERPGLTQLGILLSRTGPEMTHLLTDVCRRVEQLGVHANDEVDFSLPTIPEIMYSNLAVYSALNLAERCLCARLLRLRLMKTWR
jgi:LuxR family maltose regulon positive regulatory protein